MGGCCGCFWWFQHPKKPGTESECTTGSFIKRLSQERLLGYKSDGMKQESSSQSKFIAPISAFKPSHVIDNAPDACNGITSLETLPHIFSGSKALICSDAASMHSKRTTPVKMTYQAVPTEVDGRRMLNEYGKECLIGTGSYGKVVLHLSKLDGKLYAIKILRKSRLRKIRVAPSQTALTDVMREVEIMSQLEHPRIVNLIEVIDDADSDQFYMVLEYVERGRMFEGSGPAQGIGKFKARQYFRDAAEGLNYLHKQNVIHRDIKPENLLITSDGRVKIGDFSISQKFQDGNDMVQRSPGTPVFTAPECCSGSPYHGKTADIWALGVTLYCMLFGCYPFVGDTLQDMYHKIVHKPLRIPEGLTPTLTNLLEGLLCKDPNKRLTLEEVLNHQWLTVTEGS